MFCKFTHISLSFGALRLHFETLNLSFEGWKQIWKFQNSASPLEQQNLRSSDHSLFCTSAQATKSWLKRKLHAPKSLQVLQIARATRVALERNLSLTLERPSSVHRVEKSSNQYFLLSLQTARATEVALEQPPLCLNLRSSEGN